MDGEGRLYVLFCTILYKGLEHPLIFVFASILEPIPYRYQEMTVVKFKGSEKFYTDFQLHGGHHP